MKEGRTLKKIFLLLSICLLVSMPVCMAENFCFVDAVGTSGYYVDTDSVSFETAELTEWVDGKPMNITNEMLNACIAVKKPSANKMYIYAVQFNYTKETYQIFSSQVIQYDTKKILEDKELAQGVLPYGASSPMHSIVSYVRNLYGK